MLRKQRSDYTYRQEEAVAQMVSYYAGGVKEVYSFDLTAATDRIPIVLQKEVLSLITGRPELADF